MAVFPESLEARCLVENEDVVGATPTGDAPTTSEWSKKILPYIATYIWGFTVLIFLLCTVSYYSKLSPNSVYQLEFILNMPFVHKHIHCTMWLEITRQFTKFNSSTVENLEAYVILYHWLKYHKHRGIFIHHICFDGGKIHLPQITW